MQSIKYSSEEDKLILQLKGDNYTWEDIGNILGKTREAVRKRYYRIMNTVNANKVNAKYTSKEEHILDILKKNKNASIKELKDLVDIDRTESLLLMLYSLMTDGYDITIHSDWVFYESDNRINNYTFMRGEEGKLKIALTGDWHLGSKKQQISRLTEFINYAYDSGVRDVIVSGDIYDGVRVYKDQAEEIFLHTLDEQLAYAEEVIPVLPNLKYYMISGNHDHDNAGVNPVNNLARRRNDIVYLGKYGAYLTLNGIVIYLHHGLGSRAYALSYKLQKFVEQLPIEYTPDIIAQAHYHYLFYSPIRGVNSFEVGSFQGLTSFAKRMNRVYSDIAGWVVEMEKTENCITTNPLDKRYNEINHDYPYMEYGGTIFNF